MNVVTVLFLSALVDATIRSLLKDPDARNLRKLWSSLGVALRSPFFNKEARRRIREYNRRDFHPDQLDNTELLARWREELFGPAGRLTDRLAG